MADRALPTAGQVSEIRKDNAATVEQVKQLSVQVREIAAQLEKLKQLWEDKDMSRVSLVEARVKVLEAEKEDAERRRRQDHDSLMGWFKLVAGSAVASGCGIAWQILLAKRAAAKAEIVQDHVDIVSDGVDALRKRQPRLVKLHSTDDLSAGVDIGMDPPE